MGESDRYIILGIDDDPGSLAVLESVAETDGYVFHGAKNAVDGFNMLERVCPDIVLLDVMLPGQNGYELCRKIKHDESTRIIPVLLITALNSRRDRLRGIEAGCDDFINKPFDRLELRARIRSLVRTKRLNENLDNAEAVLNSLALSVEAKDGTTGEHCQRLTTMGVAFGRFLGLSRNEVLALGRAGTLHDLGKLGIPDKILLKPSHLTPEEWEEMKRHPEIGADLLRPLRTMRMVVPIVRHHHERWDGKGYPDSLSGSQIPLLARTFQLVDAYDALRNDRPYKRGLSLEETCATLEQESTMGRWDPDISARFFSFLIDRPERWGG